MNWDQIEGNWQQIKSKVQSHDVELVDGKRPELVGLLQKRQGHAKQDAEREIERWTQQLKQGGRRGPACSFSSGENYE